MKMIKVLLGLTFLMSACHAQSVSLSSTFSKPPVWLYADLRQIDPADAPTPSQDILAVYTRWNGADAQIRLDFLEYPLSIDHDLYIYISTEPSAGTSPLQDITIWDYLILVPARENPSIQEYGDPSPIKGAQLRLMREPQRDLVVISFNSHALKTDLAVAKVWVILTPIGQSTPSDSTPPVSWLAQPPKRLPVLVELRNTIEAYTPSQALRAWDGAHAGPDSSRHGLRYLLAAVKQSKVPIALLDLKNPASLIALDHLGVTAQIKEMADANLLILPDVLPVYLPPSPGIVPPEWVYDRALTTSQQTAQLFGFRPSPFLFSLSALPSQEFLAGYKSIGYAQYRRGNIIDSSGLTVSTRITLINAAFSIQTQHISKVFILDDDLANSSWGEPDASLAALIYIASHPWLQSLSPYDLLAMRNSSTNLSTGFEQQTQPVPIYDTAGNILKSGLNSIGMQDKLIDALQSTPSGIASELAWQMYLSLLSPASPRLHQLRLADLGQVGPLLAAASWEVDPRPLSDCSQDLDWDGVPECQLSTVDFYAAFESEGGGITYAFIRTPRGIQQIIAPTYQFVTGLGDQSTWDTSKGVAGDPNQIFAFTEKSNRWQALQTSALPGEISFSSDGTLLKTYRLSQSSLEVTFSASGFHNILVPLVALSPQEIRADWSRNLNASSSDQSWTLSNPYLSITIASTTGKLFASPYFESREYLLTPEDPNFAYPSGHYTPFPLSLIRIEAQGSLTLQLTISEQH